MNLWSITHDVWSTVLIGCIHYLKSSIKKRWESGKVWLPYMYGSGKVRTMGVEGEHQFPESLGRLLWMYPLDVGLSHLPFWTIHCHFVICPSCTLYHRLCWRWFWSNVHLILAVYPAQLQFITLHFINFFCLSEFPERCLWVSVERWTLILSDHEFYERYFANKICFGL